jgi:hypothetical protein
VSILQGIAAPEALETPPTGASPSKEQPKQQPDPTTAKAILCERISQVLGIRILRLVKLTGKEPTYQMQLDTTTIEFPNVGKFIDQAKGGEADVVFLFPDLSPQGQTAYRRYGPPRDAVIRTMYVGMTRARETLYLCAPASSMAAAL